MIGTNVGSAVGSVEYGKGASVGVGDGAVVAVGLGVSAGSGVVVVTGVGEGGTVVVGEGVTESSPQAVARTKMRPKMRPHGATLRKGMVTAIGFLATDWDGFLSPEYRDMHNPPNTSSNGNHYKG